MRKSFKRDLSIEAPSDDGDMGEDLRSEGKIKRINSSKNSHELRKFNFSHYNPYRIDRFSKQEKINKLEKEKLQLMRSLQILKNGAVSAIIEKEETIDKLRKLFNDKHGTQPEDDKRQELENLLQYIKDLEIDRNQLMEDLNQERSRYVFEIEDRERYIQELHHELNWSSDRIESLEKYEGLLQEKIKIMEETNENLSVLLNQSQASEGKERKDSLIQNRSLENFLCKSADACGRSDSGQHYEQKSTGGLLSLQHSMYIHGREEVPAQEKIKQLKLQHEVQIQDLTEFYENRLEALKKVCYVDGDQQMPKMKFYDAGDNMKTITDIPEDRSSNTNITRDFRLNLNEAEKTLPKKYSLTSLKSLGSNLRMTPIDEREEIDSPRRSLKKELMSNNSEMSKEESDKSLQSYSEEGDRDYKSKYSYKYYSKAGFKKNKWKGNCQSEEGKEGPNFPWDKVLWFTLGTLTGGSILSLGQKIFRN